VEQGLLDPLPGLPGGEFAGVCKQYDDARGQVAGQKMQWLEGSGQSDNLCSDGHKLLPLFFAVEERVAKKVSGIEPLALARLLGSAGQFQGDLWIDAEADPRGVGLRMAALGHSLCSDDGWECLRPKRLLCRGMEGVAENLQTKCPQRKTIAFLGLC